jgi:diguanylate cyclase (GGDEF)-like protein
LEYLVFEPIAALMTDSPGEPVTTGELDALMTALTAAPVAITVQTRDGAYLYANQEAVALLALADASVRMPSASERQIRASHAAEWIEGRRSLVREHEIHTYEGSKTFRTIHKPVLWREQACLVSVSHDYSEEREQREQLLHRAYYDELTGLPLRGAMEQHLETLLHSRPDHFAIVFLDIDDFKQINDVYGHAIGDRILVEFSRRVEQGLRPSDALSRISGDEFLLLLNPVASRADLDDFLERLAARLKEPYFIDGSELFASASIGASLYPDHGDSIKDLICNADVAMYSSKRGSKGTAAVFDLSMNAEAHDRLRIERSLRLAIIEQRLRCAFQPKVDIRTNEVLGVEALVRMVDENDEILAPGHFIEMAGQLGLIDDITLLVLRMVAGAVDLINLEFGPNVSISINVAAGQVGNVEFMERFTDELRSTGFAHRFVIEVTEDAFVAKGPFQEKVLPLLKSTGAKISIDDFGIGYSSLSALADLTADELKIDRSFITEIHKRPRSQGILRAIESLGTTLGMTVVAEGIETYEELAFLQAATTIRVGQGYYFSKPRFLGTAPAARTTMSSSRDLGGRLVQPGRAPELRSRSQRR